MHIAIIWQRFLPYHLARIRHASRKLKKLGYRFTAIEVASQDISYGFPIDSGGNEAEYICCFPGESYHDHSAREVRRRVLEVLTDAKPDVVFSPAIAFPEGMAALAYRLKSGARVVIMDDAWEHTARKGIIVKLIKRLIYRNTDAAFVPAVSHLSHYMDLGFTKERVVFGVDVVDNEYFSNQVEQVRVNGSEASAALQLPHDYFLFVGRVLPRKGLDTLVKAYKRYRELAGNELWGLVLVGAGNYLDTLRPQFSDVSGVYFAGAQFGDSLCKYYGLARVLIVPSEKDPWGLVVNEATASGLPVIVSNGCGAAKTLVREAENGWTFKAGNVDKLSKLMYRITLLSTETLEKMGKKSHEIIADWTLDRFVDGMLSALEVPRRSAAGLLSDVLTNLWKGRIQVT